MKLAIIGSRNLMVDNLEKYIPIGVTEIISGGAKGIDLCAKLYAQRNEIKLTEILPEYNKYKRGAPLKRNLEIIKIADRAIAFWDGKSTGTKFVIDNCKKQGVPIKVYIINN